MEKHSHDVRILDGIIEFYTLDEIYQKVADFQADIVGLSATSLFFEESKALARHIKSKNRNITIVLGGVHISVFLEKAMEECFDFGVYGEGEMTFLEFVKDLESRDNEFNKIKGLNWRDSDRVVVNPPRPVIENLDDLPQPAIHLLDRLYDYKITALMYKRLPMMSVISSRGCPYNCIFCSNNLFGQKYRVHSSEYVLEELNILLNKYKYKEIMFYEDNFPVKKLWKQQTVGNELIIYY